MKKIIYHRRGHLGDCVHTMHYIRRLFLYYPDLVIDFYIKPEYIKEITLLIDDVMKDRVNIFDVNNYQDDMAGVNAWYGELGEKLVLMSSIPHDIFFIKWFKTVSDKLGLVNPFQRPEDFLMDNNNILKPNGLSKRYNFLIVNSTALSGQIADDDFLMGEIIDYLAQSYQIITTKKYKEHPCTLDNNLALVDIANISLGCTGIISIATAPLILCLNKWTLKTCKEVMIMCQLFDLYYNLGCPNKFKSFKSIKGCRDYVFDKILNRRDLII